MNQTPSPPHQENIFQQRPQKNSFLAALIALIVLSIIWRLCCLWYSHQLYVSSREDVSRQLAPFSTTLSVAFNHRLSILNGFQAFTQAEPSPATVANEFAPFADSLYRNSTGIRRMELAPAGVIRYIYPAEMEENRLGYDLLHPPDILTAGQVKQALATREITMTDPQILSNGNIEVIGLKAIYNSDNSFWGFANVVLDLPPVLIEAGLGKPPAGLEVAIKDGKGNVFYGKQKVFQQDPYLFDIGLFENHWQIAGIPAGGWDAANMPALSVFQIVGLVIVYLMTGIVYLVVNQQAILSSHVRIGEENLSRSNRALRMLSDCNQALMHFTTEQELLDEICQIITKKGGYLLAWIGRPMDDPQKRLKVIASSGDALGYLKDIEISWEDNEKGHGPAGTAIRTKRITLVNSALHEFTFSPWRERAARFGITSVIALPLLNQDEEVLGSLTIYSGDAESFTDEETELLRELTGDISYGITTIRTREKKEIAEEALRLTQYSVDRSAISIHWIDPESRIVYANQATYDELGYGPGELIGMHISQIDPDYPPERWPTYWRDLKSKGKLQFESRHISKDGRIYPVEISSQYLEYGNKEYSISYSQDITERKLAEETLARYRLLSERTRDTIVFIRFSDGQIIEANAAASETYGYSHEELLSMKVFQLRAEDSEEVVREQMEEANEKGLRVETLHRRKDGSTFPVEVSSRGATINNERYLLSIYRDITERKKAEQVLQRERDFITNVMETSPTGVLLFSPTGQITYGNRRVLQMLGISAEELVKRDYNSDIWHLIDLEGRPLPDSEMPFAQVSSTLQPVYDVRFGIQQPDGKELFVSVNGSPMINEKNELQSVICTLEDITQQLAMENELKKSSDEYQTIFDAAEAMIIYMDNDCRVIRANQTAAIGLGFPIEQLLGKNHFDLFPAPMAEKFKADNEEVIQTGQSKLGIIEEYQASNGEIRWSQTEKMPYRDQTGKVIGVIVFSRDITERKQAEETITHLSSFPQVNPNPIIEINRDNVIVFSNPATQKAVRELGLESARPFVPAEISDILCSDALLEEKQLDREVEINGRVFIENIYLNPQFNTARIYAQEITERKKAELALEAEKELLAVTMRSISEGVIAVNTAAHIILINQTAEKLTGWQAADALDKPINAIMHLRDPQTGNLYTDPLKLALEEKQQPGQAYRTILIARDGSEHVIFEAGSPLYDKDSQVIGAVIAFRDITESVRLEEELIRISKLDSLAVLAGGIAHDFNNWLTAIYGNVSLAKLFSETSSDVSQRLTAAEKACMQASNLTQQLLTFSKEGIPAKTIASIGDLIRDSATFALHGSRTLLTMDLPDDLLPVEVDTVQISQVIQNLVINAEQAMPSGGAIIIKAENITIIETTGLPLPSGLYIKVTVSDTGIGIPPENLQRIFDPYFTTKSTGSGLGLATTYAVIRKHEGHIVVESQPGVGTSFFIYLPASRAKMPEKADASELAPSGIGRILIMDDEASIRDLLGRMLEHIGYQVDFASHGEEAIRQYKEAMSHHHPFDILILDLTVPGGFGGREVIAALKEIDPGVKAIAASGYSNDPVMVNCRDYGFCAAIAKPFGLGELYHALNVSLKNQNDASPL